MFSIIVLSSVASYLVCVGSAFSSPVSSTILRLMHILSPDALAIFSLLSIHEYELLPFAFCYLISSNILFYTVLSRTGRSV